jgi:hypothetical protein
VSVVSCQWSGAVCPGVAGWGTVPNMVFFGPPCPIFFVKTENAFSGSTFTTTTFRTTKFWVVGSIFRIRFFWFGVFDERFEGAKRVTPESVEIPAHTFDAGGVQLVDAPISNLPIEDQTGVLQHAQMLGYSRPAHGKARGDFVDSGGTLGQTLKNCQAGRISQRGERLTLVSHDLP